MQQANALEGEMPPGAIKDMVAEMYDLFDMHEKATQIRAYQKQPSEVEIAAQQLQIENAKLENMKKNMCRKSLRKGLTKVTSRGRIFQANKNPLGERCGGWGTLNPRGGRREVANILDTPPPECGSSFDTDKIHAVVSCSGHRWRGIPRLYAI